MGLRLTMSTSSRLSEKTVSIPSQSEHRERDLQELFRVHEGSALSELTRLPTFTYAWRLALKRDPAKP